jgi:hypothetical protein
MNEQHQVVYRAEVKAMSDDTLETAIAGWKPQTPGYLIVQAELERRKSRHSVFLTRLGVGLTVVATVIALATYLYKQ